MEGHSEGIMCLTKLRSGQIASGSSDCSIKLWGRQRRECQATLSGHTDWVQALLELSSGALASGSKDTNIKIWDVATRRAQSTLIGHTSWIHCLAQLSSGVLVSGSKDCIKFWDVTAPVPPCISTLNGHAASVSCLVCPETLPGMLVSGSHDKTIKVWDVSQFNCDMQAVSVGVQTTRAPNCQATLEGHTLHVTCLAWISAGDLASGSADRTIRVWDVVERRCRHVLGEVKFPVTCLVQLTSRVLVSGSQGEGIKFWDVPSQHVQATLKGHWLGVTSLVKLSPDELASGSHDKTIKLWDIPKPQGEFGRPPSSIVNPPSPITPLESRTKTLDFPGRNVQEQQFCTLSFPGIYEEEWKSLTRGEESHPAAEQRAVACVFFPPGSILDGRHATPCECRKLYCGVHQSFRSWPDGRAPWGCMWFECWKLNVNIARSLGQQGVVVYRRGQIGRRQNGEHGGLGNSQVGEVAHLCEIGYNFVECDIGEYVRRSPMLARNQQVFSEVSGPLFTPPRQTFRCAVQ